MNKDYSLNIYTYKENISTDPLFIEYLIVDEYSIFNFSDNFVRSGIGKYLLTIIPTVVNKENITLLPANITIKITTKNAYDEYLSESKVIFIYKEKMVFLNNFLNKLKEFYSTYRYWIISLAGFLLACLLILFLLMFGRRKDK